MHFSFIKCKHLLIYCARFKFGFFLFWYKKLLTGGIFYHHMFLSVPFFFTVSILSYLVTIVINLRKKSDKLMF